MEHSTTASKPEVRKQAYAAPLLLACEVRSAAGNVCGWYTQCGKQVKCRS